MMSNKIKTTATKEEVRPSLVPKLRFPEFRDDPGWEQVPLGQLAVRVTARNLGGDCTRVLTNSAERGVLDQRDYFEKDIATAGNLEGYYVVNRGDYVYNPRISNVAPVGPISRNNIGQGVMSPLYTVFRFNSEDTDFYSHYFKTTCWHSYLRQVASMGARHDRMSISVGDFVAMPLPALSSAEQQKIAECLSSVDELMAAQARKVDALKTHKKGLMQQLFPREGETVPRLRFPEFQNAGEWVERKLGTVCDIQRGKFSHRPRNDPRFFGGPYPFIQTGDVVKSEGGAVIASQSLNEEGLAVSKLFRPTIVLITIAANIGDTGLLQTEGCFTDSVVGLIPSKDVIPVFLELIMRGQKENLNKVATTGAQKNINNEILREVSILLPSVPEQQRIANCLTTLDDLITAETQKLEALKTHKKGLMQQLFPSPEEASDL
jgi:type I restriction enzyme S subunit